MAFMFAGSPFNQDLSKWDTSKVKKMNGVFRDSLFNGNIAMWNVENATELEQMFLNCPFEGDLTLWKPYKVEKLEEFMDLNKENLPYWAIYQTNVLVVKAIKSYELNEKLNQTLPDKNIKKKKPKI